MSREILDAIAEVGKNFEEYKKTNDASIKELKKDGNAGELLEKLGRIEASLTAERKRISDVTIENESQKARIEELEARQKQPGFSDSQKRGKAYHKHFVNYVRARGTAPDEERSMVEIAQKAYEAKDITIGTPAAGGYALPEEIAREIEKQERKLSPVRDLVKVVSVGTSDYKELVTIKHPSSGWVGESGSRSATTTPLLRERAPTHGELYAYPQVSE